MVPNCNACWRSGWGGVTQAIVITCVVVRAVECQVQACESPQGGST